MVERGWGVLNMLAGDLGRPSCLVIFSSGLNSDL